MKWSETVDDKLEMSVVTDRHTNFFASISQHVHVEHLLAGVSGGVISTLACHPLDVVKSRFAVSDGRSHVPKYSGITNALVTIYKQEGFRGLYRGATPNWLGAGASWGLYFLFYTALKSRWQGGNVDQQLQARHHLLCACQAGFTTLLLTNPLWVTKTRMTLQYAGAKQKYKGMLDCMVKIYRDHGFRGFYKGLIAGTVGVSHGAVHFVVYEELKKFYSTINHQPLSQKLGTLEYLTFSALSKLIAVSVTYPYQVVRVRLQNQNYSYDGTIDCIKQTWTYEGWRGFYKGLGTNLVRVLPATMIMFVSYENISYILLHIHT